MGHLTRVLATMLALAVTLVAQPTPPDARMMRGDDVRWADPAYDDSHWERIPAQRFTRWEEWRENRLWIRSRLEIPPDADRWTIVARCLCDVYLNGVKLGSETLDGRTLEPQALWLPRGTPPGRAVLAVRYPLPPGHEVIAAQWRNGYPSLVAPQNLAATLTRRSLRLAPLLISLVLTALLAGLWGQRPDLLTKLLCAYLVITGPAALLGLDWGWMSTHLQLPWASLIGAPRPAIVLGVMAILADVPIRWRWMAPFAAVLAASRLAFFVAYWSEHAPSWMPVAAYFYLLPSVVATAIGAWILDAARRVETARRVLVGMALLTLLLSVLGRITIGSLVMPGGVRQLRGTVSWDDTSTEAFGVLAAVFLVRRARERRAEEARLRGELEAARSVQALLLGQSIPAGVEAVYMPASEVGGDFYQAWETADGTMLVVGDVSGKGLHAAMTVSTIVGAVRAFRNLPPGELLGELNRVLLGNGGFVTCCCVLATPDGLRIANAGHPAPYVDGVEFAVEPGLPLGVVADAEYAESYAAKPATLTLVSDGVVEAANALGELFGFERTQALSSKSAKEMAEAAQAWGQTDDITVVKVRRL